MHHRQPQGGTISPSLSLANGRRISAPLAVIPKISINTTVLANSSQSSDDGGSNAGPVQKINAKKTTPQKGFRDSGEEYRMKGYDLVDGKLTARGQGLKGTFDFVVTNEGRLIIGKGHYNISGEASSVQAAGT